MNIVLGFWALLKHLELYFYFYFFTFVNIAGYTLIDPNAMETGEGLETR